MRVAIRVALAILVTSALYGLDTKQEDGPPVSVIGYLRDSGCVYRFHEVVKPLPNGCVQMCARAGSPLVLLTKAEEVYSLMSTEIPDTDIRPKLLPFAGKLVKISGHVYERGRSKAIAVERIEEVEDKSARL